MIQSIKSALRAADHAKSDTVTMLRRRASYTFLAVTWGITVLTAVLLYQFSEVWMVASGMAAVLSLLATLAVRRDPAARATRLMMSASLVGNWMFTVYAASTFADGTFILDAHMLFFVLMGALVAYFCWRSIVLMAGATLVHHLVLSYAAPLLVWQSSDYSFAHLLIHGIFALGTAAIALVTAVSVVGLFGRFEATFADMRAREEERDKAEVERAKASEMLDRMVKLLTEGMRKLEKGDLLHRIDEYFPKEHAGLRMDYNDAAMALSQQVLQIAQTARALESSSEKMTGTATDLSARTENAATTLQQTSVALAELTETVDLATKSAKTADGKARQASEKATASQSVVEQAITAMTDIEKTSRQIAQIVNMIDDIAFQTNLLALNAGVEAARAGEAGRGFVVVASEVQALANRSSDAAQEINTIISSSLDQVDHGAQLVQRAAHALGEIIGEMSDIATQVDGIAKAADTQASGIQELNSAVGSLDSTMQQNARIATETRALSSDFEEQAQRLRNVVDYFRTEADDVTPAQDSRAA